MFTEYSFFSIMQYQQLVVMCGLTTIPTSRPFTPPDLPFTPTLPPIGKRQADDDAEDEEERRAFDDARELLDEYSGIFEYGRLKRDYVIITLQ